MEKDMLVFARERFATQGVTEEPERLSGGWTNCVFAAGGLVLRCTRNVESGRLRRETGLARLLPVEVGYPEMVDSGSTDGYDWMLCRKIPGTNLEDAWGALSWEERADALEQLWTHAKQVHTLDTKESSAFVNDSLWYITTMENARKEADALLERTLINAEQCETVKGYIYRFEEAVKQAKYVLVHGDLTPANTMWFKGKIVALMDFECAVLAPKEADLMMLLNTAYEREDLLAAKPASAAEQRFNARMRELIECENVDWDILQGYRVIKSMHHVAMDMDDEDFTPEHEELVDLLALLKDGKGMFAAVMP